MSGDVTSSSTDTKTIRRFGLIALPLFGAVASFSFLKGHLLPSLVFLILCVLGALLAMLPGPLRPLYEGWQTFGRAVGTVITAIVLALLYFLIITPSALLKRMIGGRPLPLHPDRTASTYWVTRTEAAQPKERFLKRY